MEKSPNKIIRERTRTSITAVVVAVSHLSIERSDFGLKHTINDSFRGRGTLALSWTPITTWLTKAIFIDWHVFNSGLKR